MHKFYMTMRKLWIPYVIRYTESVSEQLNWFEEFLLTAKNGTQIQIGMSQKSCSPSRKHVKNWDWYLRWHKRGKLNAATNINHSSVILV